MKKKLRAGQVFQLNKRLVKWKNEHADEVHGFPQLIRDFDQFTKWKMDKFSNEIIGVILDPKSGHDENTHLVWLMSEYGEDIEYIETEDIV